VEDPDGIVPVSRANQAAACANVTFQAQLSVLTTQPDQFFAFGAGHTVLTLALVAVSLRHPVPDRLGGGLERTSQIFWRAASPDQINHLPLEFRRVGYVGLSHREHLLFQALRCPPNRGKSSSACRTLTKSRDGTDQVTRREGKTLYRTASQPVNPFNGASLHQHPLTSTNRQCRIQRSHGTPSVILMQQ
jgi:hypothetical protein